MKSIYCPKCDKRVLTEVTAQVACVQVRTSKLSVRQLQASCPCCGDAIADEEMSRYNLDSALEAYRSSEGLLGAAEIKSAYSRYGLTQGSFAKLLGLGGATLSRYEHGAVQTKQIDGAIRSACEPSNMIALLDAKGELIPPNQAETARGIAGALLERKEESESFPLVDKAGNFSVALSKDAPSPQNGFRTLSWERAAHMIIFLTGHCEKLGRTKLNKALFYADFACFAETARSMSGLKYARATHGPVVDGYDTLFGELVRRGVLSEKSIDYGSFEAMYYVPVGEFDAGLFTAEELVILEKIAGFVDGFATASELSAYSHKEKLWQDNDDGQQLSYLGAFELNDLDKFVD